jgi:hypothetical protein
MKTKGVKLNKKNFWIPFLVASGISVLIFLPILIFLFYRGITDIGGIVFLLLQNFIMLSILFSPPVFFIIKRLLSEKPKKVFYFELPILIIIYSLFIIFNQSIGMMVGGPIDMTPSLFWRLIIQQLIVVIVWLVLLTISLYFYYKKKILKN